MQQLCFRAVEVKDLFERDLVKQLLGGEMAEEEKGVKCNLVFDLGVHFTYLLRDI
jgi:hypothetical protein